MSAVALRSSASQPRAGVAARGHVTLLNGAPSSGKTTLARALQQVLEPARWHRSLDDFRQGYLDKHWAPARGPWSRAPERPLFQMLVEGYLRSLRAMALVGHNLISESVILPSSRELYVETFDGIEVFLVGVRCPLVVAQQRERERGDRFSQVELDVPEFELVHSHGAYDVEVDTSVVSVQEAVTLIQAALATPPQEAAFDRLRRSRTGSVDPTRSNTR